MAMLGTTVWMASLGGAEPNLWDWSDLNLLCHLLPCFSAYHFVESVVVLCIPQLGNERCVVCAGLTLQVYSYGCSVLAFHQPAPLSEEEVQPDASMTPGCLFL